MVEEQMMRRAILVGLNINENHEFDCSMSELKALANACYYEVVGIHTQNAVAIQKAFYIGTGKVNEIKTSISLLEADTVIFNDTLSPMQLRNLSDAFEIAVLDRTSLILEIFAQRAKTREATLQVELANLQYLLPRLVGMHTALSRQGGASGSMSNKGSGEKKLELDRRHIEHRISELKKNLADIENNRATMRKQRENSGIKKIALVGYTNAGKSTIMNWMIDTYGCDDEKKVYVQDMLFATLDTTIRKIAPDNMPAFLLSDTVGFIDKLPHSLVKAFHSTLEEVAYADLILHVIDYSDENHAKHIQVTLDTLKELNASSIPMIYVYNKSDLVMQKESLPKLRDDKIYLSASNELGLSELLNLITDKLYHSKHDCSFLIPHERGDILNTLYQYAFVLQCDYREDGILCHCVCENREFYKFEQFIAKK